jgi:hypothetical protein
LGGIALDVADAQLSGLAETLALERQDDGDVFDEAWELGANFAGGDGDVFNKAWEQGANFTGVLDSATAH